MVKKCASTVIFDNIFEERLKSETDKCTSRCRTMFSLLSMLLDSVEDVFMFLCSSSECKGHKKRKVHGHVQVYTTQSFAEACKPAV